ncbi:MAG: hypothetical protein K0V04_39770 [Deltaproteobacteria bacterium]|nr:hypothetical protein [Deltaproteobacteria bacterium]
MTLAARQGALARLLTDPTFEQRVRAEPEQVGRELGLTPQYMAWLARLDPARVAAFRASRQVKHRRRRGAG